MKIRPCIDIHNGKVKQIVGSSIRDESGAGGVVDNFVSAKSAAYYAGIYRELGLSGGHIILLNSRDREPEAYEADLALAKEALAAWPGGMQIGGGVTAENAEELLTMGASHVIVTSYVFRGGHLDEKRLNELIRAVGREHLVLDLSCKKTEDNEYRVVTDRWQKLTELSVTEDSLSELSQQCDEFLIHAADVEGKRGGVERDLLTILGSWDLNRQFPITYAGGVHACEDLDLIRSLTGGGVDVTVGSALDLFGGTLSLSELVVAAGR